MTAFEMQTLQKQSEKIDCFSCREVDAILIASTKIPDCRERIFYGHLPDY